MFGADHQLKQIMRRALILILVFQGLFALQSAAQPPAGYTCRGLIEASLDQDCTYQLDPYDVLLGEPTIPNLKVFVFDKNPSNRGIVECPGFYSFNITNENNAILCYGFLELTDTSGPLPIDTIQVQDTLLCTAINDILNNPNTTKATLNGQPNKYYLGAVTFQENCRDCNCGSTSKFVDQVDFYPCDSLPLYARITRRWTATDCNDLSTTVEQYFYLERPDFQEVIALEDIQINTCRPDTVTQQVEYPFWIDSFGDSLPLNQLDCNVNISIQDTQIEECGGAGYQLQRIYRIQDFCNGTTVNLDTLVIEIKDLDAPVFSGNAVPLEDTKAEALLQNQFPPDSLRMYLAQGLIPTFSTGPMDCFTGMSLDLDDLQQRFSFSLRDCTAPQLEFHFFTPEGSSAGEAQWTEVFFPLQAGDPRSVSRIPPGIYAMEIIAGDLCFNKTAALVFFGVADQISPIARCRDSIWVDLSEVEINSAAGVLKATEADAGSFDNCGIDTFLIRREVTNLESTEPFFIAQGLDYNGDNQISELDFIDQNENGRRDSFETGWMFLDSLWLSPWSPETYFSCADQGNFLKVKLAVLDRNQNGMGSPCQASIRVRPERAPRLSPLNDLVISCAAPGLDLLIPGDYSEINDPELLAQIRDYFGASNLQGDICGNLIISERIQPQLDECGRGQVRRVIRYEIPDADYALPSDSVVQTISINPLNDYWVRFPEDRQIACSTTISGDEAIEYAGSNCDLIAVQWEDQPFFAPEDTSSCYKIFRTFRVINWCEYDGERAPTIISRDWDNWSGSDCTNQYNLNPLAPDGNNQPGDRPMFVIVKKDLFDQAPDTVYYDLDADPGNSFPDDPTTAVTEGYWFKVISGSPDPEEDLYDQGEITCGDESLPNVWGDPQLRVDESPTFPSERPRLGAFGFWQYTQHLLIQDDGAPSLAIQGDTLFCSNPGEDCTGTVRFALELEDPCIGAPELKVRVEIDLLADGVNMIDYSADLQGTIFEGEIPLGTHRCIVTADDHCGNISTSSFLFRVVDCQAPRPNCRESMVVELLPEESSDSLSGTTIFASDMIAAPVFDCYGQGPETNPEGQTIIRDFSIHRQGDSVFRQQDQLILSCDDVDQTLMLEVHAWDENDQHDFCVTAIMVRDEQGYCPDSGSGLIAGQIYNDELTPISEVELYLSGGMQQTTRSSELGDYEFENLTYGKDYRISPRLDLAPLNGVSTLDILLIQQHILGNMPISSPYRLLAADANDSGAISTLDMIELRKLILNIDTRLRNQDSWRFIDAEYEFADPSDPWAGELPEWIEVDNLFSPMGAMDFIGIKIGDVSGNARTGKADINRPRSTGPKWLLTFPDFLLRDGQRVKIPFRGDLQTLQGMQLCLEATPDRLNLTGFSSDLIGEEQINLALERNILSISALFARPVSDQRATQTAIFILEIEAKKDGRLSDFLHLNTQGLVPEVYRQFTPMPIELRATDQTTELELSQNYPNPFRQGTNIEIKLAEAGQVNMRIMDLQGRIIRQEELDLPAGRYRHWLPAAKLPGPGVYLIEVQNENQRQRKRMIYF